MPDLETAIARGEIQPVYVLSSEDPLLIDRVLGALREAALPAAARAFNSDVLEGKSGAGAVLNAARTLPMMG